MRNKKLRTLSILLALVMVLGTVPVQALSVDSNTEPSAPTGLMMELSSEPLGVEAEYPSLSWVVNDADQDEIQTAYRILVATSEEKLVEGQTDIWDSGKVLSEENTNVRYGGEALPADGIYCWTVKTWDKDDTESPYAQPQFFTTAVKENWDADAIWYDLDAETNTEALDAPALFKQAGLTDYTLETSFVVSETALGFVIRKPTNTTKEDSGYLVQVRVGSGDSVILKTQDLTGAGDTEEVTSNQCGVSITAGTTYRLKISAMGKELKVWINDTLITTRSDVLAEPAGTFGIRCGWSESGYVDDMIITAADGRVYLQTDFSGNSRSVFANGGTVSDGHLKVSRSEKLYHVVAENTDPGALMDYILECDFSVSTTALGFILRKTTLNNTDNGYLIQLRLGSGGSAILKTQDLSNVVPNEEITAEQCGIAIEAGKTYRLKVSAIGSELKVWVNDILLTTRPDFFQNAVGTFGIRCGGTESGYVDNIRITRADGTVYMSNTFDGFNPFSGGGKVSGGKLALSVGEKIYYLKHSAEVDPKGEAVFLRKEFSANKPVEKAIVSAIGKSGAETHQYVFKMYLNGQFAGLGSPRTYQYADNVYNTFDVTPLIQQGENCIGVTAYALSDQRFQARLKLFYTDGTTEVVSTDETWTAMDGTAAFGDDGTLVSNASFSKLMAENIDARVYPYGYDRVGYDDSLWTLVKVKETFVDLTASQVENMQEYVVPVQSIGKRGDGLYIVKLEKEVVGGLRLRIPNGVAGTTIKLAYGEELAGPSTVRPMRTLNDYDGETWTLRDGEQVIEHWGMRNFRYINIDCPIELTADMIEGVTLHQPFDDNDAALETSSDLLDDIFEFMKYSIKATNQDLYVDSQARERGPANGDAYINQLTSYGVSRNYMLAKHSIEYFLNGYSSWSEYNKFNIINTWDQYLYTGDAELLEAYYDEMVAFLYLNEQTGDTGLYRDSKTTLVDWPTTERDGYDVDNTQFNTVVNAFQYKALLVMADVAELLGKDADAEQFTSMAADLKQRVNDTFYNVNGNRLYIEGMSSNGTLCSGNAVHATLYPLRFGMVDDETTQAEMAQYLADKGMVGSVYFSQFYLEALYANGQADAAMEILTSTGKKSWAHMMNVLGATISCEGWVPSIKSNMTFSHPWGSAAGNIIVRETFGIQPLEAGFEKIQIKPQLGTLEYGTLKTPTIKGSVEVSVQPVTEENRFAMTVTTPANTLAKVYVPVSGAEENYVLVDGELVQANREGDFFVFDDVGSGSHTFAIDPDLHTAAAVDAKIEAIGEVTLDSKAAIDEARAAYDALSEASKALVTKLDVLVAAEADYAVLTCEVTLKVTGGEDITVADEKVSFTVSAEGAEKLATLTLKLTYDQTTMTDVELTPAEGWSFLVETVGNGEIEVIVYSLTGLTGTGDLFTVEAATTGEVGDATVATTEACLSAFVANKETYVAVNLDNASATVKVDYNVYDVNRDGTVNQLDITRAQRWYGTDNDICDVNNDGDVNIDDMILILNNYSDRFD